jgi:hypothetical protein
VALRSSIPLEACRLKIFGSGVVVEVEHGEELFDSSR